MDFVNIEGRQPAKQFHTLVDPDFLRIGGRIEEWIYEQKQEEELEQSSEVPVVLEPQGAKESTAGRDRRGLYSGGRRHDDRRRGVASRGEIGHARDIGLCVAGSAVAATVNRNKETR